MSLQSLTLIPTQTRFEQKSFWRNPASALFTFAFPVVLFVLFGALFKGATEAPAGNVKGIQYYTPVIAAWGVMSACFVNLAIATTFRRETGLLKRVKGTPLPPSAYLGGVIVNAVINAGIIATLITAVGVWGYGAVAPRDWVGFVASLVVGAAAFCTLGLAATIVIPNADAAPAMINIVFIVLVVISGGFFPLSSSSVLAKVAEVFPLRHFIVAAFGAFDPRLSVRHFPWGDVVVLAAWGVGGLLVAIKWFRWEPRRS